MRHYRGRFDRKRRQLVQDKIFKIFNDIDEVLEGIKKKFPIDDDDIEYGRNIEDTDWLPLRNLVGQIDILLGSSIPRPPRWRDLQRHLHYAEIHDLRDIVNLDWLSVKTGITNSLSISNKPIPVSVKDLSDLVTYSLSGTVLTKLNWEKLSAEDFERLVFNLVALDKNHENPQWLMRTKAPDRGRDLSVNRVYQDTLSGVTRKRVIIQCKHWLTKSVTPSEISALKEQVKLWEPPRIDILVIATTGRFTADAIGLVEKHNQSDSAMTIDLWSESHFERILASNPALVAEFGLR